VPDAIEPAVDPPFSPQPHALADVLSGNRTGPAWADRWLRWAATAGGFGVLAMLAVVLVVLAIGAWPSISVYRTALFTRSQWQAAGPGQPAIGAGLGVLFATLVTAVAALALAVLPSIATAIFITRIASQRLAGAIHFIVECFAAIPPVAWGLWGMLVLVPALARFVITPLSRFDSIRTATAAFSAQPGNWYAMGAGNLLNVSVVLALMIAPTMTARCCEVLKHVGRGQIEAAIALGATWWQSVREMLTNCRGGLIAAGLLGLARATGETMAVIMVLGPVYPIGLVDGGSPASGQTIASLLANRFGTAATALERSSLIELALVLLVLSLIFTMTGRRLDRRHFSQPRWARPR
jgi:phosphate ABC transporter permease protein PstC